MLDLCIAKYGEVMLELFVCQYAWLRQSLHPSLMTKYQRNEVDNPISGWVHSKVCLCSRFLLCISFAVHDSSGVSRHDESTWHRNHRLRGWMTSSVSYVWRVHEYAWLVYSQIWRGDVGVVCLPVCLIEAVLTSLVESRPSHTRLVRLQLDCSDRW